MAYVEEGYWITGYAEGEEELSEPRIINLTSSITSQSYQSSVSSHSYESSRSDHNYESS